MSKFLYFTAILFIFSNLTIHTTFAAPTEEEITELLTEMNWTMEELEDYLSYYELTTADFETIEDLEMMLGTPINDENLAELLQSYNLTREELDVLLAEFGESTADYQFIEDLEMAVDFYMNHDEVMEEAEAFLAQIGLTEEEVEKLFNHLMALDETVLEAEMAKIEARMEPFMMMEDLTQLTEKQEAELISIWEAMLTAYHLKGNFYLVDRNGTKTAISYADLIKLETLNENSLFIELFDFEGNLLMDMQLSDDMFTSDFLLDAGGKLTDVGDMAGELTDLLHDEKLPNTASPYWLNALIGFLLLIAGCMLYRFSRKTEKV
ncbi:processed acidic surface protein [Bacillus taeanensis]|uniref:Processed acidic surface protein n=1 Tax=Bacillus taeanensis TaxID=273032 RepID=A0A366XNK8_9BACI|nr:processed acidic surface protein [Bacillus taeanensis]RBW67316.1 processed acidic surface protein [Bacillus taeanensis]